MTRRWSTAAACSNQAKFRSITSQHCCWGQRLSIASVLALALCRGWCKWLPCDDAVDGVDEPCLLESARVVARLLLEGGDLGLERLPELQGGHLIGLSAGPFELPSYVPACARVQHHELRIRLIRTYAGRRCTRPLYGGEPGTHVGPSFMGKIFVGDTSSPFRANAASTHFCGNSRYGRWWDSIIAASRTRSVSRRILRPGEWSFAA